MSTEDTTPAAVGSNDQLGLVTERDIDGEPYTTERLAQWLEAKYSRHREEEDEIAAKRLRLQAEEIQSLRAALKWYADGEHFTKSDPDAWDTVSDEPQNWWCDEAGTAMVEDGSLAGMVLAGKLTGARLQALADGEEA